MLRILYVQYGHFISKNGAYYIYVYTQHGYYILLYMYSTPIILIRPLQLHMNSTAIMYVQYGYYVCAVRLLYMYDTAITYVQYYTAIIHVYTAPP